MNKQIRKLVALMLTVIMTVSCLPLSALAEILATDTSGSFTLKGIVTPEAQTHYVTYIFKVNGAEVDRQIVKSGDGSVVEPASPSVEHGKRFDGWYVGGSKLTFGPVATLEEDKTVEVNAVFSNVYYVYFIGQKGEVCATGEATESNGYKVDLPNYEPKGARVVRWYDRSTGVTFTNSTVVNADTYVDAELVDCYWVTFDAQGGTPVDSQYLDEGQTLSLSGKTSTLNGYTFGGWSLTKGGTKVIVPPTKPCAIKRRK